MNKSCCSLHPAWMKTTAVFLTAMKLFLSQWNFYGHAETIPRSKVSAWLFVWITKGVRHGEKYLHKDHNETNPKMEKAENPCPARIFGKRKSSIVSDTLVSKLSNLFGGAEGNRTPVRKQLGKNFSGRSVLFTFPHPDGNKHPAGISSFMMHGMGKAYHTHVLYSNHTRARLVDLPGRMGA